jgi:hypothetical protein
VQLDLDQLELLLVLETVAGVLHFEVVVVIPVVVW